MNTLMALLGRHALILSFLNVLAVQLGLPLPVYPLLVVIGAWTLDGRLSLPALLATAVAACLVADLAWYAGGRRFGSPMLRTICRISLSPDSCVRQTETLFARWGPWSLLVAKFVPGFGTIAAVLSGRLGVPLAGFVALDIVGAGLYVGVPVFMGRVFHAAIGDAMAALANLGHWGLILLVVALAAFLANRWWQRHRLIRELRMTRITVPELERLIDAGSAPAIIDARSEVSRQRDGTIPGAVGWSAQAPAGAPLDLPRDVEVVVYCACPNELSAARVAQQLRRAGFRHVRPLQGGIDAWIAAGRPIAAAPQPETPESATPPRAPAGT